jgi:23S rRNA G2445 N2-methylase RlmL
MQYYETNAKLYQQFNEKLKTDVEKWGQFLCDAQKTKESFNNKKLLMKSCSTPTMIVGFELE